MLPTTSNRRRRRFALPACLTASLAASLTACSGSGSHGPALGRADAQPLVTLAQRIAGEGACAQRRDIARLQRRAVALVNARRVPEGLQDPLMSGVNALAEDSPPCVPAVPVQTAPPPAPAPGPVHTKGPKPKPPKHEHGHGHGHGHHSHGKGD